MSLKQNIPKNRFKRLFKQELTFTHYYIDYIKTQDDEMINKAMAKRDTRVVQTEALLCKNIKSKRSNNQASINSRTLSKNNFLNTKKPFLKKGSKQLCELKENYCSQNSTLNRSKLKIQNPQNTYQLIQMPKRNKVMNSRKNRVNNQTSMNKLITFTSRDQDMISKSRQQELFKYDKQNFMKQLKKIKEIKVTMQNLQPQQKNYNLLSLRTSKKSSKSSPKNKNLNKFQITKSKEQGKINDQQSPFEDVYTNFAFLKPQTQKKINSTSQVLSRHNSLQKSQKNKLVNQSIGRKKYAKKKPQIEKSTDTDYSKIDLYENYSLNCLNLLQKRKKQQNKIPSKTEKNYSIEKNAQYKTKLNDDKYKDLMIGVQSRTDLNILSEEQKKEIQNENEIFNILNSYKFQQEIEKYINVCESSKTLYQNMTQFDSGVLKIVYLWLIELSSELMLSRKTLYVAIEILCDFLMKENKLNKDTLQLNALTCLSFSIKLNEITDRNYVSMKQLISTMEEKYQIEDLISNEYQLGKFLSIKNTTGNVIESLYMVFEIWDSFVSLTFQNNTKLIDLPQFRKKSEINYSTFRQTLKIYDYLTIYQFDTTGRFIHKSFISIYYGIIFSMLKLKISEEQMNWVENIITKFSQQIFKLEIVEQKKLIMKFSYIGNMSKKVHIPESQCENYQEFIEIQTFDESLINKL